MNLKIAATLLAAAAVCQTQATTLTFESAAHSDQYVTYVPTYSESGFTLNSTKGSIYNFGIYGSANANYAGSTTLYNNYGGFATVLTRDGGGLFNALSLDVAELLKPAFDGNFQYKGLPETLTFKGFDSGGLKATQTFTLDGLLGFQTVTLNSAFQNLTSFEFTQSGIVGASMSQFDNIQLSTVPDGGSSLALIGIGFGALGFVRRFTSKA